MVDWSRILAATGEVVRGLSDAAIVNNWLEKDDEGAFACIVTQVSTSSTDEVDRLDAALLSYAASNFNLDVRRRLIKFYALFKIAEFRRYQQFRGFPQLAPAPWPGRYRGQVGTAVRSGAPTGRRRPWPRTRAAEAPARAPAGSGRPRWWNGPPWTAG